MADLSPTTRAIVAAFNDCYELCGPFDDNWQELCLAAALRVAVDAVVPYESAAPWNEKKCDYDGEHWEVRQWVREKILAIAAELKSCNE